MNLDHFLTFWSHHNQTIIQALIVVTLIFIVALVFVTLFGSKTEEAAASGQVGLSPELEKSLKTMLENQTKAAVFDFSKGGESAPAPSTVATTAASAATETINTETLVEVQKLKDEVSSRDKKIQDLNTQLAQAVSQATKDMNAATGGAVDDSRIKELEARLAEYDIISEDIADLSRYKDENEKLKAELANLKGGGGAAPAPATPPPAAAPAAPPEAPPAPVAAAPVAAAPVMDAAAAASSDEELMKEFAAAVANQKTAETAPPVEAATVTDENAELMGQFENFVNKKEGS